MHHYKFTNDLRISTLDESLRDAAQRILTNTVPNATENKSMNNNINTLKFYFNLQDSTNCLKLASEDNTRSVVLNFVKKFQFPNPRTQESYDNAVSDNITLAPMQAILKLLYIISICEGVDGYITKEEILNFIFYNTDVSKNETVNYMKLYFTLLEYRKSKKIPNSIETEEQRNWEHEDRQLREMLNILTWTDCVTMFDGDKYKIKHKALSIENKAEIFDIVNYNNFWKTEETIFDEVKRSYKKYMDINEGDFYREAIIVKNNRTVGENILIYGVPGCGKSFFINTNFPLTENNSERVVFHPDYTYSDFIGQILPVLKEINNNETMLDYKFVPGPFTRILDACQNTPHEMHYLIIEEINRGNAPAIFGEVFQLLDRDISGVSEYGINNTDVAHILYNDKNKKIKIPSNLTILATMNTADQSVFTLDTAFKRRWLMKSIKNDFSTAKNAYKNLCTTNVTWVNFATKVNDKIIDLSENGLGTEDKRLGVYFLKNEEFESVEKFSEKIIMYLWNDVFKFDKDKVFNSEYKTLEKVLEDFSDDRIRFKVFNIDFDVDETKESRQTTEESLDE